MGKRKRDSTLPDSVTDSILGTVRFSCALDGVDEYQARVQLAGRRVFFDLYSDENGRLQPCIHRARKIVNRFPAIQQKMRKYVEKNIFPSYNEVWRLNQRSITFEEFMDKLRLTRVSAHSEPKATFWLTAGNLFHGHILRLMMAERNVIVDHDMPG